VSPVIALLGRVLAPDDLGLRLVVVEEGRVVSIGDPADPPSDALGGPDWWVTPGFVDIQLNGAFGVDFAAPDADLAAAALRLPATGVTAFLPTLVSSAPDVYAPWLARLRAPMPAGAARSLGAHLEGPFITAARAGTHDPSVLRLPDADELRGSLGSGVVRIVTFAPELPGAESLVAEVVAAGAIAAIGHSDATWREADAAIGAGVRLGTHLFNAMRPFHHRDPGIAGRLLAAGVAVSVVCDSVHVAPEGVRLLASLKGPHELVFVTDGVSALGEAPGSYRLGAQEVVSDGSVARRGDGSLSGSATPMATALGRLVRGGLDPVAAVRAASTAPARLLGLADELGMIAVGRQADLVVMDGSWEPQLTLVQGRVAYAG